MSATIDDDVRLEVYRFFVDQGRPPVPSEIARALARDQGSVEETLHRLHAAHVLVLAPGTPYIWMANPFSAVPTSFTTQVDGRRWFGNCIWDALGIIAMLGGTGTVRSSCPDCGDQQMIAVHDNDLVSGDGVVHFAVPAARWWDDIGFN